MKSIISKFLGAALLLALPLSFTSCEDILGKWDKPIPPAAITLKNALDNGAQVQFSYKIGDTPHTATFLKEGDVYNLVGDGNPEEQMLTYDEANNRLIFVYSKYTMIGTFPKYDVAYMAFFDIATTSFFEVDIVGNLSFDGNINIQGTTITIPNACPKEAIIALKDGSNGDAIIYKMNINYAEGDTWQDVYDRLASYGLTAYFFQININSESEVISYGDNNVIYDGGVKVKNNHFVGKDGDGNAYDQHYEVTIYLSGGGTAPVG